MTPRCAPLSEAQAARILEQFERDFGAYDYAVDGISVWRLLRFSVGMALQNLPFGKAEFHGALKLASRWFYAMLELAWLLIVGRRAHYMVKTYATSLRVCDGMQYRDIYFDELLSARPGGIKVQFPNAPGYDLQERNAFIRPVLDTLAIQATGAVLGRLLPVRQDNGVFQRLARQIAGALGLDEFDERRIRRTYSSFRWQALLFEILLRRLKPHAVLVVDTGERALLAACQRLRILFVELQHGIFTANHPDALPAYALDHRVNLLLPDVLAVFGDYWRQQLADTAFADRMVSAGASIIDRYRDVRDANFVPNPRRPVPTLTTQGLDTDNLIDFVRGFLSISDLPLALNIKLHPAYDTSGTAYVKAFAGDHRVRILAGSDNPNTYALIALSDLHLSIASACHYDALGIGVPTVVIGLAGHELMANLLREGDAILAATPAELATIVNDRAWRAGSRGVCEKYFKPGFIDNISAVIG